MRLGKTENFINELEKAGPRCPDASEKLYERKSREGCIRRHNLRSYLDQMEALSPAILLLGEAPGYKGCRLTGVPFTSEKILRTHPFFLDGDYKFINPQDQLMSEQSATIIWNVLDLFNSKPLIWNIFPFHPYKRDNTKTNRTPDEAELNFGKQFLIKMLDIFPITKIAAVGRKAESKLIEMNLEHTYIRHPANGGKRKFVEGMKEILNE
jgi:uracil-DNA glycosylase